MGPAIAPITPGTLHEAYKGLSKNKAPGSSRLRLSAYFQAGPTVTKLLSEVFDSILTHQACPPSWLHRLIVHVPKSDNLAEVMAGAVRPISLLETDQRFFYRILNDRIMGILRRHPGVIIDEVQACLPGAGCAGPLMTIVNVLYHHIWAKLPLFILSRI